MFDEGTDSSNDFDPTKGVKDGTETTGSIRILWVIWKTIRLRRKEGGGQFIIVNI